MTKHLETATTIPRTTWELLRMTLRPYRSRMSLFFVLTFVGDVFNIVLPLIIAAIVNHLSDTKSVDQYVWNFVGLYAVCIIANEVLWRAAEFLVIQFKPQMIETVRWRLFTAVLGHSHAYFVGSSSGRIGHWINETRSTVNEFIDTTLWNVWSNVVYLILSAVFLFTAHWSLAVLFIVWLGALFTFNVYRGHEFSRRIKDQSDEISKASGRVVDAISNHLSVRVFGAAHRETTALAEQQKVIAKKWRYGWMQNLVTNMVKGQSAAIVSSIALVLVIWLYMNGTVQLGSIIIFVAYFGNASGNLWTLAWALDSYFRNFGTIQNALDGLNGEDERPAGPIVRRDISASASLELRDLSFAYQEQPDVKVLQSLSIVIAAGEKVGVVGHSGAGKSTLAGLLLGFYEPSGGEILINGEKVSDHDLSYVRSMYSYVPQDSNLFNRTIRDNVLYARSEATEKELITALKRAQAYDFVQKLPHGLDTEIGERGVKLSGGQRQRLAIARAILQDVPLLLLDEATSALDSVSEQAIQKALHELMKQRTAIVIAHRLSTLRHMDRIVVLEGGKIVENGSHDELLARDGIYADLWHRQKDGFIVE